MASTFKLQSHSYGGRYIQVDCSQAKDIEKNESPITWKISSIGGSVNYYTTSVSLSIGGVVVYNSGRVEWNTERFPAAKGSTSGTVNIKHDDYGNKTIDVVLTVMIYDGVPRTQTEPWILDSIPRQAELTHAPDLTDNDYPTITYKNPAGNSVGALMACISWTGGDDIKYRDIPKTGTDDTLEYTFPLTDAERDALRNAAPTGKRDVTFYVTTVIGGKYYYSTTVKKLTIQETDKTKPSVSMEVALDNSSLPSKFDGLWVQGKSRANISVNTQSKYGAPIQSVDISIGNTGYYSPAPFGSGPNYSPNIKSDVITSVGSVNIIATAKDLRGFTGKDSEEINVLSYSKPLVIPISDANAILCYRSDGNGIKVGSSTSLWIKAKRFYYNVNGINRCALQWRKKLSTDAWVNDEEGWEDLISKDTTTDEYNALLQGVVFDLKKSYTVQIRAIDDFDEYDRKEFDIPTQDVALHLGKGGKNVSVGTYCDYSEDYTFYSDWDAYFDKDVYIGDKKLTDYVVEQNTEGIWTYRKWASGVAECWGLYPITNAEVTAAWGSLFETATGYQADFPEGLFTYSPVVSFSVPTATGGVLALETMGETTKDKTCSLFPVRAAASTLDLIVAIYAIGKTEITKEEY